jgi:hydrogenase maturation factor
VTPALVIAVDGMTAEVDHDGRRRRASLLIEPDVVPGDWVIVGSGAVLRRLDPAEAREIRASILAARSTPEPTSQNGAQP